MCAHIVLLSLSKPLDLCVCMYVAIVVYAESHHHGGRVGSRERQLAHRAAPVNAHVSISQLFSRLHHFLHSSTVKQQFPLVI